MKKMVDALLTVAVVIPVVLLFWPFAMWNDVMSLILRIIPSLAGQILLCRIEKWNIVKALPALFTGAFAAWGTYLYFTSPHWNNATFGDLIADYVSPFICCVLVLIACLFIAKKNPVTSDSSNR